MYIYLVDSISNGTHVQYNSYGNKGTKLMNHLTTCPPLTRLEQAYFTLTRGTRTGTATRERKGTYIIKSWSRNMSNKIEAGDVAAGTGTMTKSMDRN
jgi:hypothetical protein